jgi:hypothetical protein
MTNSFIMSLIPRRKCCNDLSASFLFFFSILGMDASKAEQYFIFISLDVFCLTVTKGFSRVVSSCVPRIRINITQFAFWSYYQARMDCGSCFYPIFVVNCCHFLEVLSWHAFAAVLLSNTESKTHAKSINNNNNKNNYRIGNHWFDLSPWQDHKTYDGKQITNRRNHTT